MLNLVNTPDLPVATGAVSEVMHTVCLPHRLLHCQTGDALEFPDVVS